MISDIHILDAWEVGQALHPLHRALETLRLARPDDTIDALARLTIAERDRELMQLRAALFGPQCEAIAPCPACGETLDIAFSLDTFTAAPVPPMNEADAAARLPDTTDLIEVAALPPPQRATALAERLCGRAVPEDQLAALEAALAARDPLAEISLGFECPECGHGWNELFDIAAFLWDEIDEHAVRLLRETDLLARTYGWSESEILAIPPRRRQIYLDFALDGA